MSDNKEEDKDSNQNEKENKKVTSYNPFKGAKGSVLANFGKNKTDKKSLRGGSFVSDETKYHEL